MYVWVKHFYKKTFSSWLSSSQVFEETGFVLLAVISTAYFFYHDETKHWKNV